MKTLSSHKKVERAAVRGQCAPEKTTKGPHAAKGNAVARKRTRANLSVLAQLCNLIPAFLVSKVARECGVDKKARSLSPWSHRVALLYAQFTHALSLNEDNAVLWQARTALILRVLPRFLAFSNSWKHGFKRLFCLLRSSVWDGVLIASLASLCGTAGGGPAMRAAAEQLYVPGFEPREART